jgi:DNA invertase Pin-like site-specific DNA recombinase
MTGIRSIVMVMTRLSDSAFASGCIAVIRSCKKVKGRPATISPDAVRELRSQSLGATEIAKQLRIGRASVYRALNA